ncbi:MAG: PPC domain-containing protein, partial [Planctomycetes bacterium]|nr:PPC domain-containing protein [Planctomycetota bacterium]
MAPSLFGGAPDLQSITPAGVQRGTDAQLVFSGARLEDVQGILFYRPGIAVKKLAVEGAVVKADCSIAADCVLGEMPLRLRTASGISDLRTIWIGALPVVAEAEPNNDFAAPQAVPLEVTVSGVITNEDVDHFVVQAKHGQRITAEVEGMRLGRAMFDPRVAILDAKRFELASCDDSTLLLQDPVASIVAPADGSYVVQIREASFGGGNACAYRLHIGTFPRPTVCFPPGGTAGQSLTAQLRGDAAGDIAATITLPGERLDPFAYFPSDAAGAAPSPVWVRVVNYPCVVEQPGAPASQASQPAAPAPPIAFEGVLDAPQQADVLRFHATKGQVLDVRCVARALRSPLDAVIDIMDASGAVRASSDDVGGADPSLRFTAIADGDLSIRVRDQRGRGGPLFVYHLEIEPPQPSISAALERLDGRRPQFLQSLSIPRGGQMAAMIRVERKEVDGPAVIEPAELPKGVTLIADELPAGQALLPVVFQAAADAPLDGGLYRFGVRLKREGGDVVGQLRQTMPLVIGAPNDTVYYQTTVDSLAVAAAEPTPFRVQLVVPPTGVLRDGAAQLKVIVERQAD